MYQRSERNMQVLKTYKKEDRKQKLQTQSALQGCLTCNQYVTDIFVRDPFTQHRIMLLALFLIVTEIFSCHRTCFTNVLEKDFYCFTFFPWFFLYFLTFRNMSNDISVTTEHVLTLMCYLHTKQVIELCRLHYHAYLLLGCVCITIIKEFQAKFKKMFDRK